jgi:hypothetical protein
MTNEPRDEDAPLEAAPNREAPQPAADASPEAAPAEIESAESRTPGPAGPEQPKAEPPASRPPEPDPPELVPVVTAQGAPPIEPVGEPRERRPWLERLGLGLIALVIGTLFGAVAVAAWSGGEPFLGIMGGLGCVMTLWVGVLTIVRG